MEKILHPSDLLARFGGDELGSLLPQIPDAETVVARSAHKMLEQPFAAISGFYRDRAVPDQDFEELMQHADVAITHKGKRAAMRCISPSDDSATRAG